MLTRSQARSQVSSTTQSGGARALAKPPLGGKHSRIALCTLPSHTRPPPLKRLLVCPTLSPPAPWLSAHQMARALLLPHTPAPQPSSTITSRLADAQAPQTHTQTHTYTSVHSV